MCDDHNDLMTENLRRKHSTFKIFAKDVFADGLKQGKECPPSAIPANINDTAGIPSKLEIGIGSRILLRRNINTDTGLVNGATGEIKGIEWRIDKNHQMEVGKLPKSVKIKFDHETEPRSIYPTCVDFMGRQHQRVSREMLPIILCWACTTHKLQGATVDRAVVFLGSECKTKGLAYVAISRLKTLEGLAIVNFNERMLFNPADKDALQEIGRLRGTVIPTEQNIFDDDLEIEL